MGDAVNGISFFCACLQFSVVQKDVEKGAVHLKSPVVSRNVRHRT
jgi:hypothetical protein